MGVSFYGRIRPLVLGLLGCVTCCALVVIVPGAEIDRDSDSPTRPDPSRVPWSFEPIRSPEVPRGQDAAFLKDPIDAFVLEKLAQHHLAPGPPAPPEQWLRRVYFDLIGLPPSPDAVLRFERAPGEEARAAVVEELLASPAYGERWARHWLDVVRYADTGGFEADLPYPNAWRYRDYVIRSFNSDKPLDRFVREQVAGDELWPDDREAVTATSVYCVGPVLQESAMVSNQLESEWLTDAADITGAAFLGLTLGCARCHDHKYDPISQKDYYSIQAFFAASDRVYPEKVREQRLKALNGLLAEKPLPDELKNDPRCTVQTEAEAGWRLIHRREPLEIHVLRRGELSRPKELVGPAVLSALRTPGLIEAPAAIAPERRRAALAAWLVSPSGNPLTPRVLVNRVWAWHFGQGIVRTPNDFGKQGEPPTHPELLDWLAREFIDHGWSLKHLHRLILLSSTYAMDSRGTDRATNSDPENRWLSHFPRHRLDGEGVWDAMHACAGTLNLEFFGPPIMPPLTKDELTGLFQANEKWKVTPDPAAHGRRGLYLFERRTFFFPVLDAFDPPDVMSSCPRRFETTVPAQALALLNSRTCLDQAKIFATRLLRECGNRPEDFLPRAWLLAFGRPISDQELSRARAFLDSNGPAAKSDPSAARTPESREESRQERLAQLCLALFNANEFVYLD